MTTNCGFMFEKTLKSILSTHSKVILAMAACLIGAILGATNGFMEALCDIYALRAAFYTHNIYFQLVSCTSCFLFLFICITKCWDSYYISFKAVGRHHCKYSTAADAIISFFDLTQNRSGPLLVFYVKLFTSFIHLESINS